MNSFKMVVIDFETTGNQAKDGDRIIQIGAAVVSNGQIVDTFSTYINPEINIPSFITKLTTITNDQVKNAPIFAEVAPKLLAMLDEAYFVAHNVPFDLHFLQVELNRTGYSTFTGPTIDTVELARLLYPSVDSYKLQDLAEWFTFEHKPHQADSDAYVTAQILIELLNKIERLPLPTLKMIQKYRNGLKSDIDLIIERAIVEKERNVFHFDDNKYDLFRNLALQKRVEKEESEKKDIISFDDWKTNINHHLKRVMDTYEVRESQMMMMNDVQTAFLTDKHAMIEAGTGTGKSLAYLFPAIFKAVHDEEPVIVSTHTIQLQEQLMERDLPILKQAVPFQFEAALLKGRNHYLCLRKFEQQIHDTYNQNYDELFSKLQILLWLTETLSGDVEELQLSTGGRRLWYTIQSDANSCLNRKCPFFSRCFYHRARKKAQEADMIITNHALLFTDLTNESRLLPKYTRVIIDEAHHIEQVASEHFGDTIDYFTLQRMFTQFFEKNGPYQFLHQLLEETDVPYHKEDVDQLEVIGEALMREIDDLFTFIHQFAIQHSKGSTYRRLTYRFTMEEKPDVLADCSKRVDMFFYDFLKVFSGIKKACKKYMDHFDERQKGIFVDIEGRFVKFEEAKQSLTHLLRNHQENNVYWIEVDAKSARNAAFVYSQPIEISDRLAKEFFNQLNSAILTSATLSVNDSFSFLKNRLGLNEFEPIESMITSPFEYKKQAKLMISTEMPDMKGTSNGVLISSVVDHIFQIAIETKGRMLVLFTSNQMLRDTYEKCKEHPNYDEFIVLAQNTNQGSRSKLTRHFKEFERAILLGTSSFWEGVDIPGDDLKCVMIVRLPFSPPDNPIFQSQSEQLKQIGQNPFMQLSIPQAVLRFKQGFGRLIRTSDDSGIVVVLDRRIVTTRYGKSFIKSLPDIEVIEAPLDVLAEKTKRFLS